MMNHHTTASLKAYFSHLCRVTYNEIEHLVRTGRVDIGFSTPQIGEGLESVLVAKDELLLVAPTSHRFAQMDTVSVKLLEGESFFLEEMGRAGFVSQYLKKEQVRPFIELKTHHDNAILNMVKMELGVSILPELVLRGFPVEGVCFKELEPRGYREILLVLRQGTQLSFASKRFLVCFRDVLKKEIAPSFSSDIERFIL